MGPPPFFTYMHYQAFEELVSTLEKTPEAPSPRPHHVNPFAQLMRRFRVGLRSNRGRAIARARAIASR